MGIRYGIDMVISVRFYNFIVKLNIFYEYMKNFEHIQFGIQNHQNCSPAEKVTFLWQFGGRLSKTPLLFKMKVCNYYTA